MRGYRALHTGMQHALHTRGCSMRCTCGDAACVAHTGDACLGSIIVVDSEVPEEPTGVVLHHGVVVVSGHSLTDRGKPTDVGCVDLIL